MALVERVARIAREMKASDGRGPWSTGERIAGALLNGRPDWFPDDYRHPVDAMERLGQEWWEAVVAAHHQGWATDDD